MIAIKNKKTYSGPGHYIGRPSIFQNRHRITEKDTREKVIAAFRKDFFVQLQTNSELQNAVMDLIYEYTATGKLTLICWCYPEPCHGDILKEFILDFVEN